MSSRSSTSSASFWVLAKNKNHEISCVEICFIFLANIENFMIGCVTFRGSSSKTIEKSLDVCKKSLQLKHPKSWSSTELRHRSNLIFFHCVFEVVHQNCYSRCGFVDKFCNRKCQRLVAAHQRRASRHVTNSIFVTGPC